MESLIREALACFHRALWSFLETHCVRDGDKIALRCRHCNEGIVSINLEIHGHSLSAPYCPECDMDPDGRGRGSAQSSDFSWLTA